MMEMQECKLFFGNLSVCEQLPGREKPGKLECSKNIVFKDVRVLLLKQPNGMMSPLFRTIFKNKEGNITGEPTRTDFATQ